MSKEDHFQLIALTNAYKAELSQIMNKRKLSPEVRESLAQFIFLELTKPEEEQS